LAARWAWDIVRPGDMWQIAAHFIRRAPTKDVRAYASTMPAFRSPA
jgi:hypothetical protein